MNFLGMVLPATFFQQKDEQQFLTSSGSGPPSESSIVGGVSRCGASTKLKKKALWGMKNTEASFYPGFCQKSSESLNEISRSSFVDAAVVSGSDGLVSSLSKTVEPSKRSVSKKKSKKKKKKCSSIVVVPVAVTTASQTFCVPESPTREVACVSGLTEQDRNMQPPPHQFMDGKGDPDNYKAAPSCNSNSNHTTIVSEEIKPSSEGDKMRCISGRINESLENSVLEESLSRDLRVNSANTTGGAEADDHIYPGFLRKQYGTLPASAAVAKVHGRRPICAGSNGLRDCDSKLSSEPSFQEKPDSLGNCILPVDCNHQKSDQYGSKIKEITCKYNGLNITDDKVMSDDNDCASEGPLERFCFESVAEESFSGMSSMKCLSSDLRISKGANDTARDGRNLGVKYHKTCFATSVDHAVAANKCIEGDATQSNGSNGTSHTSGHLNRKQTKKENGNFIWRKTRKDVGDAHTHNGKKCIHHHTLNITCLPDPALQVEHDFSIRQTGIAENPKDSGMSVQRTDKHHGHILVETSPWAAQQKLPHKISQNSSRSREYYGILGNKGRKLKGKMHESSKHDKTNNFRQGCSVRKASPCGSQTRPNIMQKETIEVPNTTHICRSSIRGQAVIPGNQGYKCPLVESHTLEFLTPGSVLSETLPSVTTLSGNQRLLDKVPVCPDVMLKAGSVSSILWCPSLHAKENRSRCCESNVSCNRNSWQGTTSRVTSQKWRHGGGTYSIGTSNMREIEPHEESVGGFICEMPNILGDSGVNALTNGLINNRGENCASKDYAACNFKAKDASVCVTSQMAVEIMHASYRLQIASESVQLVTGSPIAEFEKLLYSASPVIVSSFSPKSCNICSRNQLIPNICRHQFPNISLGDVWSWYEEPGNYGLKVEGEASQKILGTDGVPFHAYFVPSLSAVQLFGQYSSSQKDPNSEMLKKDQDGNCSFPSLLNLSHSEVIQPNQYDAKELAVSGLLNSLEKHMRPIEQPVPVENCSSNLVEEFDYPPDSKLLFEYFEHERPEQRKPLHAKIKELIRNGASNSQLFGDPTKLERVSLHDLHVSSWYSVAWYPIYQIPEGSFRASFLTYHSLGQLVRRGMEADSMGQTTFCIVSPVLGMLSYNAQGECWFNPKKAFKSFSKDGTYFDNSDIIKERLRTLEETASMFSRGTIYKDQVKVTNKHSDYEFFLSRRK